MYTLEQIGESNLAAGATRSIAAQADYARLTAGHDEYEAAGHTHTAAGLPRARPEAVSVLSVCGFDDYTEKCLRQR